jgi:hypothetical protein
VAPPSPNRSRVQMIVRYPNLSLALISLDGSLALVVFISAPTSRGVLRTPSNRLWLRRSPAMNSRDLDAVRAAIDRYRAEPSLAKWINILL